VFVRAAGDFKNILFTNGRRNSFATSALSTWETATIFSIVFESTSVKTRGGSNNYRVATRESRIKVFPPDTGSYEYSSFGDGQKFAGGDVFPRANRKSRNLCDLIRARPKLSV